jgi:hypothetical protein
MKPKWTKEWPTKAGAYWFYGDPFFKQKDRQSVRIHLIVVRKIVNALMCVTDGYFMFKEEASDGYWLEAVLPDPPEEKQ